MILGQCCFNIFMSDVDDGTKCALSKSVEHVKLGGMVDPPHDCIAIERDVDKLEKWANGNLVKFRREVQSPETGKRQPHVSYRLRADGQENSLAEKALGVLVDQKLSMSHQRWPLCPGQCSWQVEEDDPSCLRSAGESAVSSSELPGATETRIPWR